MSTRRLRDLEIQHPDYVAHSSIWRTIKDLKEGVCAIKRNVQLYLPKRPDEDSELYHMRLQKFSYTPVMSDAVNKYSAKLAGSPVHLSGADNDFWSDFRANNASPKVAKRKEANLLHEIFNGLLYYSRIWAAVDRPDLGVTPRTAYESQGLPNNPYVVLYDPLDIPYWGDDWAISKHYYPEVAPFQQPKTICRWTYWGLNENIIYEAEVKLKVAKDSEGNYYDTLKSVWDAKKKEWLPWDDDNLYLEPTKVWQHNLNERMITTLTLPSEKWVCKQVYNKQVQHLRIENAWTDAGYLSGVVQRLFTPPDVPPSDDPRITYEQPDYANELRLAGNAHILVGNGYQFVESTGSALANLQGQLDKIEQQIKELVSLHFASANTSVLDQSGASKAMDMSLLEDSMKDYGQQVISLYNSILRIVSKMLGLPEVTATGLSSYSVDKMEDLINQLSVIEELPYVPPTAKKITYGKLAQLMVGTASPEDEEKIKKELDELFADISNADEPLETLESPDADKVTKEVTTKDLAEAYGFTEEEALGILGGLNG
ncbi:MAG: hypothetical protein KME59_21410 [Trichormus sp. ATA11-4-KO1]|jgi:hypothetical protein|nr:hypothetical protein [Trichormus sp. ATA11-4-KO1]